MFSQLIVKYRPMLNYLDQYWHQEGATAFGVWFGEDMIFCSESHNHFTPDLSVPLIVHQQTVGSLELCGVEGSHIEARLQVDATMFGQLLELETELEDMTGDMIGLQDQLLALYDLTQASRYKLNLHDMFDLLAREVTRLTGAASAFAIMLNGDAVIATQIPEPYLNAPTVMQLLSQLQNAKGRVLVKDDVKAITLPSHIHNLILQPIWIGGTIIAAFGLMNKDGGFSSPDMKLIQAIAEQAGAQIENLLLHQEMLEQTKLQTEMKLAQQVQLQLLPQSVPQVEGIDIFAVSRPALQVGGDFYDLIAERGRPLIFTVGDVSGKGMPAALLMAMTRIMIHSRGKFMPRSTPAIVLDRVNEEMYDDFTEVGMFATVFLAQFDPDTREISFANAGHSPVVHYHAETGAAGLLEADGTALGILPVNYCENQTLIFNPNDILVIATDGFNEAADKDGNLFGYDRLLQLIETTADETAEGITNALFNSVEQFGAGHPQDDDQTIIVIKGVES
jgi:sigma-B regulation protein RsbU (phosphoserine phosphatase)